MTESNPPPVSTPVIPDVSVQPPPVPAAPLDYHNPHTPRRADREFPVQAAKYSCLSAIFVVLIGFVTAQNPGPRWWMAVVGILSLVLMISGLVMGIVALVKNRQRHLPGVTGFAVTGICLNGLFLLLNLSFVILVLTGALR